MKTYLFLFILLCNLLSGCSTEYSAVYQSVKANSKWDESARIIIANSEQELTSYIVKEDTHYLMIQVTQVDGYFRSVTNYPLWGKAEIRALSEKHNEVKPLVPADWNNWLAKGYGDECKSK